MASADALIMLVRTLAAGDHAGASKALERAPELVFERLPRTHEIFIAECHAQLYSGDTALHAAAFAYDALFARELVANGADVRAKNRRGAEPLHAAAIGAPGSANWNPARQSETIAYLVAAGADPNASASGGVTPLHRAVRNRCSPAVEALLAAGADPSLRNDSGSTAHDLARWTTGKSGSGSPEAKAEQEIIVEMLRRGR